MHCIAHTLKQWRIKLDLSQRAAAQQLNVSIRTLQNWEQGRNTPDRFTREWLLNRIKKKS
jgi:DNA-binding transcriptional regulator YiaG